MIDKGSIDWAILPKLNVPFRSAIHAYADLVHANTVEWLHGFQLLKEKPTYCRFYDTKIGRLAARFHPVAPLDDLQLISDWYGWMFYWDDLRDETDIGKHPDVLAARNGRLLEILASSKRPTDDPLAHALSDLRERLLAKATAGEWMRRFVKSVKEHFDSTVWEATNRSMGIVPDIEMYIRMRPVTGGLKVDTQFVDIAEHAFPSSEVWRDHLVRRMSQASDNAVCWANDIFSLDKEIQRNDVHNLVLVLQQTEGCTLQAAVRHAIEMCNAEVQVFVESCAQLQPFDGHVDDRLERFVAILQARMRGFVDWAQESGRYQPSISVRSGPTRGSV